MAAAAWSFTRRLAQRAAATSSRRRHHRGATTAFFAAAGAFSGATLFYNRTEAKGANPERAEQGNQTPQFPSPEIKVPGVMPLKIVGHTEDVTLQSNGDKIPLELALYIDPLPSNVASQSSRIPEEARVMLKPNEPFDRCLVLYPTKTVSLASLAELLVNHVSKVGLRQDRLDRVFDPSVLPKTPPGEALEDLKKALLREDKLHNKALPSQSQLAFIWRREGFLDVRLNDKRVSFILSPELSWAVFDSFLGPYALAPSARKELRDDVKRIGN